MSIYNILSCEIPIIGYSFLHQPDKSQPVKEYSDSLFDFRDRLKEESILIKSSMENYINDLSVKSVQNTRGNLSQFLTTPIQTDTDEIQRILKDQVLRTCDQLHPKISYGLFGGYESKYFFETKHGDLPKQRTAQSRTYMHNLGLKVGRETPVIFESFYMIQGAVNLDIIEHFIRNGIGIYNSPGTKPFDFNSKFQSSLHNLIFLDGTLDIDLDRFELEIDFTKGKVPYNLFNKELSDSMKFFRTEIHNLNVSVWQRKLGLGLGREYTLRVRTKDRSTLRSVVMAAKRYLKEKNSVAESVGGGAWFVKELL